MTFFPLPGTYAVVEIDVGKTLQPLDDPVANAAGAGINTTKCIVYLDFVLQLPFPDDATFKYMAYLVGPGLRPENLELCITPDMCMPIFPNTYHPSGTREPLKTAPPFPFSNCYHWFGPEMWLDLRLVNDGRDYGLDARTELPPDQHVKMIQTQGRDIWRSICAQEEKYGVSSTSPDDQDLPALEATKEVRLEAPPRRSLPPSPEPPVAATADSARPGHDDTRLSSTPDPHLEVEECDLGQLCDCCEAYGDCSSEYGSEHEDYHSPDSSVYRSSGGSNRSAEALDQIDIFGLDGDERDDFLPIVKIWLDLGAHFEEEDVPDPMEFMRQRDELVKIIEESKARERAAREAEGSDIAVAGSRSVMEHAPAEDSSGVDGAMPSIAAGANNSTSTNNTEDNRQPTGLLSRLADASASLLRMF